METLYLKLASEVRASCGTEPFNLWSLTVTLGSVRTERNFGHLFGMESWRSGIGKDTMYLVSVLKTISQQDLQKSKQNPSIV